MVSVYKRSARPFGAAKNRAAWLLALAVALALAVERSRTTMPFPRLKCEAGLRSLYSSPLLLFYGLDLECVALIFVEGASAAQDQLLR